MAPMGLLLCGAMQSSQKVVEDEGAPLHSSQMVGQGKKKAPYVLKTRPDRIAQIR